ncbi:hypothetical protein RIF29_14696 [Crotalaria pallida]|uniref:PPPDE domain-containing protein n=1 Tax=Crotalaria pallida TaxID=3830 RepID=A0AAN9ICZ0_CROPI
MQLNTENSLSIDDHDLYLAVHGVEYAFGAHDFPTSGVFELEPRQCPRFRFRKSILIGTTSLDVVQEERIDRDNRIGRLISDAVGTLPKLPPSTFDKIVNDSLQQKQNRGRMNGYTISQGNAHSSQLVLSSRESSTPQLTGQAKYVPSGHQREMEKGPEFSSSSSNSEMLHSMLSAAPPNQRLQ